MPSTTSTYINNTSTYINNAIIARTISKMAFIDVQSASLSITNYSIIRKIKCDVIVNKMAVVTSTAIRLTEEETAAWRTVPQLGEQCQCYWKEFLLIRFGERFEQKCTSWDFERGLLLIVVITRSGWIPLLKGYNLFTLEVFGLRGQVIETVFTGLSKLWVVWSVTR